jgi:hypothetical protein
MTAHLRLDSHTKGRATKMSDWSTRVGTCHFVSIADAASYYRDTYPGEDGYRAARRKIDAGEIHIGKPTLKEGELLTTIDEGRRYAIIEPVKPYMWRGTLNGV